MVNMCRENNLARSVQKCDLFYNSFFNYMAGYIVA